VMSTASKIMADDTPA
jgi:hypothetical protein